MAIKSEVKTGACDAAPYPCLMVRDAPYSVVLMTARGVGTLLSGKDKQGHGVGFDGRNWDMDGFRPFAGSVSLSNEAA